MNPRIFHITVCLAVLFSLAATGAVDAYDAIGTCSAGTTTQSISFVHVGDLHGHFDLTEDRYSRIHAFLNKVRQENPNTVFTNAGDDHEKGSVAEQYSHGDAVTEATFAMQFDVRTIGNHDFAWGADHLLDFSRDPHSLVLASNTTYDGPDPQGLGSVDYGVLQVGCLKVGFFGLVGPSWNELDHETYIDYLPSFHTKFDFDAVAGNMVNVLRNTEHVDLVVMVSHLGLSMNRTVAADVPGIDVVLGGHSHVAPGVDVINNTLIVQPDYCAEGVTRVDLVVDVNSHATTFNYQRLPISALTDIDPTIHQKMSDIMQKYAPDVQNPLATLEQYQDPAGMAAIAAKASIQQLGVDAALLDPARVGAWGSWPPGEVTTQDLINGYYLERQPSNTPGINSLYMVEVSGSDLQLMRSRQPAWVYSGPTPDADSIYKVIVHKGAALDPSVFFSGITYRSVSFLSESWEVLAGYASYRTASCLSLDTDAQSQVPSCRPSAPYSQWTFSNHLQTDFGPGALAYWNNTNSVTSFGTTSTFSLPPLADGPDSGILSFPKTNYAPPGQGYVLTHNVSPNGDFSGSGLVSNYTLVMDVLWPAASDHRWRALLQTNINNIDDADWFVNNNNAIGSAWPSYYGALASNTWYRLAVVANAAATGGRLQYFIDGRFAGELDNAAQRWALGPTALLFADDDGETQAGYSAGLLFAGFAMTGREISGLGGAQVALQPSAVNGVCGRSGGGSFMSQPRSELCHAGTADAISGNGPWTWNCRGWYGGATAGCSADKAWMVTPAAGAHGSISPSTALTVVSSGAVAFTVTPDTGYHVDQIAGCGGSLSGSIYTTAAITSNCTVSASFAINDSTPPALTLFTPVDGSFTNNASLTVAGSVKDDIGVTMLLVGGVSVSVNPDGSFSRLLTLAPGINAIDVTATDAANNTASFHRTVMYDSGAPGIVITTPGQDMATPADSILIQGAVSDSLTTVYVIVMVGADTYTPAVVNGGFQQLITLPSEGRYVVRATATDGAGNSSTVQRALQYVHWGDLDSSGDVSVGDALLTLRMAAGLIEPTSADLLHGDVAPLVGGEPRPDGRIDIGDVVVILRKTVGLGGW